MFGVVYLIKNQVNGMSWVGQTKQKLKRRWNRHCAEDRCPYLYNAIKKYGKEAFQMSVLQECNSSAELDAAEIEWIEKLGTIAPGGYNLRVGGTGRGATHKSTQMKMRASALARPRDSIATRQKKRESQLRRTDSHKIKNFQAEAMEKWKRPVVCISTGERFESVMDAAQANGVSDSMIRMVASGKRRSARNLLFRYEKEDQSETIAFEKLQATPSKFIGKRSVICIESGEKFESLAAVAEALRVGRPLIWKVVTRRLKTAKGLTFRYENELKQNPNDAKSVS